MDIPTNSNPSFFSNSNKDKGPAFIQFDLEQSVMPEEQSK